MVISAGAARPSYLGAESDSSSLALGWDVEEPLVGTVGALNRCATQAGGLVHDGRGRLQVWRPATSRTQIMSVEPERAPTAADQLHARRWLVLILLGVAQLMVTFDVTIVNIALPLAQKALRFSAETGSGR